jgi:O-antigen/teichoic acid export membrane protein
VNIDVRTTLVKAVAATISQRLVQSAVGVLSVPIMLNGLGVSGYATFITISAYANYFTAADFGLGAQALTNASGKSNSDAGKIITGAAVQTVICALAVGCAYFILRAFGFESKILNLNLDPDLLSASAYSIVSALVLAPLIVLQKLPLSRNQEQWNQVTSSILAVINLGVVWLVCKVSPDIKSLAVATGTMSVIVIGSSMWLFSKKSQIAVALAAPTRLSDLGLALKGGIRYWYVHVMSILSQHSDVLIVGMFYSHHETAAFYLHQRIFALGQIGQYAIAPLLPIFSQIEAQAPDSGRKLLRKYSKTFLIIAVASSLLTIIGLAAIMPLWTQNRVEFNLYMALAMSVASTLSVLSGVTSMFMSTGNRIAANGKLYAFATISTLVAKVILAQNCSINLFVAVGALVWFATYTAPILLWHRRSK